MKRVLTIQDISCWGKCSITVALPIISAMGSEVVILPTALLSTHTAFKHYTCTDLTDTIGPILDAWRNEGITFDAIYTGYLGSASQIRMVEQIIDEFATDKTLVFVDPVMADFGKLYPAFDMSYAEENKRLCKSADIVVPNITEACFMTGTEYREDHTESYIKDLLDKTSGLGAKITVITGVAMKDKMMGIMGYDREKDEYFHFENKWVHASFHGTGDLFSSTAVGAIMRGMSWQDSMRIASEYTAYTIEKTMEDPDRPWYGVNYEKTIPYLVQMISK